MIINNSNNAVWTPCPAILFDVSSNSFSMLTTVSFATERLVGAGAVCERDGIAFEFGAAAEVARLSEMNDAASGT